MTLSTQRVLDTCIPMRLFTPEPANWSPVQSCACVMDKSLHLPLDVAHGFINNDNNNNNNNNTTYLYSAVRS